MNFKAGDKVLVKVIYGSIVHRNCCGVVKRKCKNGYRVEWNCSGVMTTDTANPKEMVSYNDLPDDIKNAFDERFSATLF